MASANIIVAGVILNQGLQKKTWAFYKKKIRKISKIGILGAINGIMIRKWFTQHRADQLELQDIEKICEQHNIPFETTPSLNSQKTVDVLRSYQPDIALSLGNGYISSKVFSVPAHGMLNIHGEVLPDFQNAQSVIWQLYEGRSETGYTIHRIDTGIDTGDILKQEKFPINFRDTLAETVSVNCAIILERSAQGLVTVLNDFDVHQRQARKQGKGKTYTTPSFRQYLKIKKQFKKLKALAINSPTSYH